jgi:hypothetical protein
MNCPICSEKLSESGIRNKIFNSENLYCNSCHSYHIIDKIDDFEYYANRYHSAFNYKKILSSIIAKLGLVSNRCISRFRFIQKYIVLKNKLNYLEIGGGSGENFIVYKSKKKPKQYTIVEPNSSFNIKHNKLRYFNNIIENIDSKELENTDIVLMFHVLEHIFDLETFFKKIKEINPKYFYFEVPNIDNKRALDDSLNNHPHYHHFSIKSVELLLNKQEFEKIAIHAIDPNSYHPYKKVGFFKRYSRRIFGKNEIINNKGLYIRGLYQIRK